MSYPDLPFMPGPVVKCVSDPILPLFPGGFVHPLAQHVVHLLEHLIGWRLGDQFHHSLCILVLADRPIDLNTHIRDACADSTEGGPDPADQILSGFPAQLDVPPQLSEQPGLHRLLHVLAQVRVKLLSGLAQALDGQVKILTARGFWISDDSAPPLSVLDREEGDLAPEARQSGTGTADAAFEQGQGTSAGLV